MVTKARMFGALAAAVLAVLDPVRIGAQVLGTRPITIVVPFAPGASTDALMRLVTTAITEKTGQAFVIENKTGAGGIVGATAVKSAPPDGYTLLQANAGSHAIIGALQASLSYDPVKDFAPITLMWSFPHMLVVPAESPARSVTELVAYARTKPDGLSFASPGSGSGGHILGEMLKTQTGAPFVHVPFRGAAPAMVDLVAGRVDMLFASYASVAPFVEAGKLRPLGLAGPVRLKVRPDVPTMAEAGFPGVDLDFWFGLVAPAGTPEEVIKKLNTAFVAALSDPAIVKQFEDQGVAVVTNSPSEFAKVISSDGERLAAAARSAGIKPQ
jgi:tripartite-type tricarboxylate transporter receptor subunit TctC